MENNYKPEIIEQITQEHWQKQCTFEVTENDEKDKFYCLSMLPYPSGQLHMGHVRNYTLGDVITRYQRMLGKNVLQPMGWDAFGLPAENAAIKHKLPPSQWTYQNIDEMRNQLKRMGFGIDWQREVTTCKPEYYRWEQWLFLQMYKKDLVYKKNAIVNWDPVDQTVLANEQVVDGRGWRSGALVERREIPQWFLKITAYADDLLNELDNLEGWPEQVKTMQRNWIGRSAGTAITFDVEDEQQSFHIFTTCPHTLMGATFLVIAAEHPLAQQAAKSNPAIAEFIAHCRNIKVAEAEIATMEKQGMPTDFVAIHPITGTKLPIWIANYVLMEYGSGAVMAVPAHDQRDFEFSQQYQLPIKQVVTPADGSTWDFKKAAYTGEGKLINSEQFDGLTSKQAIQEITDYLIAHKKGERKIHYRLRDWGISRQRYWGAPIPMIDCPSCGTVPLSEEDLPVILPEGLVPQGGASILASMPEFYEVKCPKCGAKAKRETDTFDTFMESSWYYARYTCPDQDKAMLDKRAKYWLSVDQYIGGIEHAVMHLLYARFIHKVMYDEGLVSSTEPFTRLLTQGMVLKDGAKMSKSKGNTVSPQDMIDKYGADTVRLFITFTSPPEQSLEWSDSGIEGSYRFLKRFWAFAQTNQNLIQEINKHPTQIDWNQADPHIHELRKEIHAVLQQANFDMERLQFNTVVSAGMKLLNILNKPLQTNKFEQHLIHEGTSIMLRLLNPITPHITHHLWQELNYGDNIETMGWPTVDKEALKTTTVQLMVQINGKLRSQISVPANAEKAMIEKMAITDSKIQKYISNAAPKKIIIVPNKLINIVI